MALEEWAVANLFVGGTLLLFALTLAIAARRGPERALLAVFLLLVGVNYLALGVALPANDLRFSQVARLALSLDPFFLLAFVTLYPYPQRSRAVVALLVGIGAAGLAALALVVVRPDLAIPGYDSFKPASPYLPGNILLLATLAVAYGASWILTVRAAARAPTPQLAHRARWLAVAVGVATVPRLAVLHRDLGIIPPTGIGGDVGAVVATHAPALAIAASLLLAGRLVGGARVGRPLLVVAGIALALFAAEGALFLARGILPLGFASALPFALRWLVFAAILLHGMLWLGAVEIRRAELAYALLAAGSVALLAGLVVAGLGGPAWLGVLVAPACGALSYVLVRRSVWRVALHDGGGDEGLEIFHARLEEAYARSTPDIAARERLDRERRRLGVSPEAARALEHVVARRARGQAPGLRPGDEPIPGIVVRSAIARGSQSTVVSAERLPGRERLVLKEIAVDGDPTRARRALLEETRALRALRHPHVVPLLDVSVAHGRYILVMPDVDARPLSVLLAAGARPAGEVVALGEQILDALAAAHAAGIVHRDVKPDNILLRDDGHAYLADFGIAASAAPVHVDRTLAVEGPFAVGTPAYLAPEVARQQPATPQSDLFALGLVLLEALVGRRARDLRGFAPLDALVAIAREPVDLDGAPAEWLPFLARALDPEPARRFASAREMRDALLRIPVTAGTKGRSVPP